MMNLEEKTWKDVTNMSPGELNEVMKSVQTTEVEALHTSHANGYVTPIGSFGWDGEKVPGEIGVIKKYHVKYRHLTLRSWQNFIESDITQAVIRKYVRWIVGSGLKLQAEPMEDVIEQLGIQFDKKRFIGQVEPRFRLYCKSKRSSYDRQMTLNKIMEEAKKNAVVGGDVLVVMRTDDRNNVSVELIDGERVNTTYTSNELVTKDRNQGLRVRYGVAYEKETKRHVAYYVRQQDGTYKRIQAQTSSGMTQAFLFYGLRYRLDNIRGIPLATACLQTVAQLDRYKEATVGSAEERQKIVYFVKHDVAGTGESIHARAVTGAIKRGLNKDLNPDGFSNGELPNLIATTTNKQAVDMPKGAELKSLASQNELNFGPFMKENLIILCATLQIPYEVALSKYENTFSASRMASQDWQNTIWVERDDMGENFCDYIYRYWLNIMVMSLRITVDALVRALFSKDEELYDAIVHARWTGRNVPHIDPLKEVQAQRAKLGAAGANAPLTTPAKATEELGSGEWDENLDRFTEQMDQMPDQFNVTQPEQQPPGSDNDDDADAEDQEEE